MILLDTDVMIDLLRKYPPAVAWLGSIGEEEVVLPGFVVMELIQGCRNKVEQQKVSTLNWQVVSRSRFRKPKVSVNKVK